MKQVIFLEPWTTPMIYKIARMFKQRGYYTISIRVLKYKFLEDDFFKDGFDEIISFNQTFERLNLKSLPSIIGKAIKKSPDFFRARKAIKKLNPCVIICRTPPNWLCALTKKRFPKIPLIYFPYDMRSHGDLRLKGYNLVLNKIVKEKLPKFEIKAEKYCFENSDGIMHKGSPEELDYLDKEIMGEDFKICPLQIQFPPYCSKDFIVPLNKNKLSKKDGEIHIVTAESSGSSKSGGVPASYVIDFAKEFIKQKIHLHVYVIPNVSTAKDIKEIVDENYGEILKSKYFHFHEPLDPKTLIKEMSKYDYGIILLNLNIKDPAKLGNKLSTGNKIASYMEAGIPMINYKHYDYMNEIVAKYDLSFTYETMEDIKNLKKTLSKLNYQEIEQKIVVARQDFLMEKHFPRLEKFIEEVVESRRLKNEI